MTMVGLVVRHVALKVQAALVEDRREEIRQELLRRLDGPEPQQVRHFLVRKIWSRGTSYVVRRSPGWRVDVRLSA